MNTRKQELVNQLKIGDVSNDNEIIQCVDNSNNPKDCN
jgi:hypothetical protein